MDDLQSTDHNQEKSFLPGNLIFVQSAKEGEKDKVASFIEAGVDVNAQDGEGIWASYNGYIEIAKLLINNGADVNIKNKYGNDAMKYALNGKHKEIIDLIDKIKTTGSDYKKGNEDGNSSSPKISFKCPSCYEDVNTNSEFAGKKGNCPKCGKSIVIPTNKGNNSRQGNDNAKIKEEKVEERSTKTRVESKN